MTKKQILEAAGYQGHPGRKKKMHEPATAHNIVITDSDWEGLPDPKPDHVRMAVHNYVAGVLK